MLEGLDSRTALIYRPIAAKLAEVERRLRELPGASSGFEELSQVLDHVLLTRGKRVRPAITLLSYQLNPDSPPNDERPILMAVAVELLHIATLIHDDTVDNSPIRHGRATLGSLWGHNVALLVGDYVFATSATFVCDTQNIRVVRRFAETLKELSSGELLEYFQTFQWNQTRQDYLDRIYRKTASLFRTAAETGAILSGAPEEAVKAMEGYGYNLGIAFQIVDDILDFQGNAQEVGKPVGNDLLQGVMTLPAILLVERSPEDNPIRELFEKRNGDGALEEVIRLVQRSGIIEECYAVAESYCRKAAECILGFQDSPPKDSLLELTRFVMERRR